MFLVKTLSTQEFKWVLGNCQGSLMKFWGVTLQWLVFIQRGVVNYSLLLHATETMIKVWLDGQHGLSVDFTFQLCIWLLSNAMYCR